MKSIATQLKQSYLGNEVQLWQRSLDFIQQENIYLKNTLADILKAEMSNKFLDDAEYFQNQFLNKDVIISLLRRDIAMQSQEIVLENLTGKDLNKKNLKKQDKLREDMEKMEREFSKLKFQFCNYLSTAL